MLLQLIVVYDHLVSLLWLVGYYEKITSASYYGGMLGLGITMSCLYRMLLQDFVLCNLYEILPGIASRYFCTLIRQANMMSYCCRLLRQVIMSGNYCMLVLLIVTVGNHLRSLRAVITAG